MPALVSGTFPRAKTADSCKARQSREPAPTHLFLTRFGFFLALALVLRTHSVENEFLSRGSQLALYVLRPAKCITVNHRCDGHAHHGENHNLQHHHLSDRWWGGKGWC